MEMDDGALLAAVLAKLESIDKRLAQLEGTRIPTQRYEDAAAVANLVALLAVRVNGYAFTASDLLTKLPRDSGQFAQAAMRVLGGNVSARKLGKFLARHEGQRIAGHVIERDSIERGVVLWLLRKL